MVNKQIAYTLFDKILRFMFFFPPDCKDLIYVLSMSMYIVRSLYLNCELLELSKINFDIIFISSTVFHCYSDILIHRDSKK